ncbi:MAG: chromosomal replication initiator protein DnaA [Deltaproteobacteria bacterium]|nr:chromosomal replication initiator protein DnaA [Deltaproteobacteria bacterium]MBW2117944.1 chromosomal replication initiator protein DnaA [Deltaproteobacteria bacterium]MBW2343409.1 chromosomal replication initiator protein DnaA [Deltaproteobacteria bacterium]
MLATWNEIKGRISSSLPKNSFSLWIDPISFLGKDEKNLVLSCPNRFARNWVMENYLGLIRDNLHKAGAGHLDVVFEVHPPKRKSSGSHNTPDPAQLTLPNLQPRQGRANLFFNRDFTFDRFIVGRSNEFAYSASRALAHTDQWDYHSLLMLANTGLGKTHLSQAVGQAILEENPQSRVYYITAEQFTNEMISSIKKNRIEAFKDKYRRSCDVLLLDEIHFLSGKQKTQIELGYTLDALTNENKKIIFTSALPPKDLPNMSKELSSRLTSGLVTTIESPNYETRVKILIKKASEHNLKLPGEIIHLLATRLNRDVRQMESALNYLKAKSQFLKARIDLDLAKDVINSLVSGESSITTKDISKLVCSYYKVDPEMLRSKSRKKVYSYPRNIYSYLCRNHTIETLEKIAGSINRSHSTVLYASELVGHKIKTDRDLRNQIDFLSQRLENMKR